MYEFLLVLIVGLLVFLQVRERFSLFGQEILSWTPKTCRPTEELDAGLCYKKCDQGYNGVGPVCWAESQSRGVGTPVGLEPCPDGWNNDGLVCREPLRWDSCKSKFFGLCVGGLRGGRLKGRLDNGGVCPGPSGKEYTEKVSGLCYKKCPEHLPEYIKGMPYLCYRGGPLSYGRGVGGVPSIARVAARYVSKDIVGI